MSSPFAARTRSSLSSQYRRQSAPNGTRLSSFHRKTIQVPIPAKRDLSMVYLEAFRHSTIVVRLELLVGQGALSPDAAALEDPEATTGEIPVSITRKSKVFNPISLEAISAYPFESNVNI